MVIYWGGEGRGLRQGGGGGGGARTAGAGPGPGQRSLAGRGHCGPPEKRTGHRPIGDHRSSFGRASSAGAHAWHHGPDASFQHAQSERGRGLGFRGPAPCLAGGLGGIHCPGSKWGSCRRVLPSAQVLGRRLMRGSETGRVLNLEAPLAVLQVLLLPLIWPLWVSVSLSVKWAS